MCPGTDVDEQAKKEIKEVLVKYDRTLLVADPRRCEPKKCAPGLLAPGRAEQGWSFVELSGLFYQPAVLYTASSFVSEQRSLTSGACAAL